MITKDIVVVGSSAGGIEALLEFVSLLPADFKGTILVVQHLAPHYKSNLDNILTNAGPLKAIFPRDGDPLKKGCIYLAPPDHHLLVEKDRLLVKKGTRENRFRPSIDALFRSAAYNYGERVIGIVLSGLLDDGTSGLWYIKRLGGVVLVQNPFEAAHGSMPQNVLQHVDVDKVFSVTKLPALLQQFMEGKINATDESSEQDKELLNKEVIIASPDNALELGVMNPGILSPFTCPECHTRLFSIKEANDTRFICPAGHAFSSSALLEELTKSVEETLWSSLRGLEETIMLLETKGKEFETNKDRENSLEFYKKAEEVQKQSHAVRKIIFDHEHLG